MFVLHLNLLEIYRRHDTLVSARFISVIAEVHNQSVVREYECVHAWSITRFASLQTSLTFPFTLAPFDSHAALFSRSCPCTYFLIPRNNEDRLLAEILVFENFNTSIQKIYITNKST